MNSPVGGVVIGFAAGAVFAAGAIHSVSTGTVKFKSGASLDRKYQPQMFWRAVAGLICAAAFCFFWAVSSFLKL